MDRVEEFRLVVRRILEEYAALKPSYGEVEVETIFDDRSGHYEVTYTGWDGYRRIHGSVLHVDIRGDKVWIQHDGTEGGIAEDLVRGGVPRDHIVLGFKHPDKRPFTEYAPS